MIELCDVVRLRSGVLPVGSDILGGQVNYFFREEMIENADGLLESALVPCHSHDPAVAVIGFTGHGQAFARPADLDLVSGALIPARELMEARRRYAECRVGRMNYARLESTDQVAAAFLSLAGKPPAVPPASPPAVSDVLLLPSAA